MANLVQLHMLENLNGFLLVDKPVGIAFSTVVKTVKRMFNLVKVGHGGSLDTAASGLLVLLINDANKYVGDVMGADRVWTGELQLGKRTNTGDAHGVLLEEKPIPAELPLEKTLADFRGDVFQTENAFCSVRREGSLDYEVVSTGAHEPFMAHVYRFEVEVPRPDGRATFTVAGTKGLIVRTLIDDLGAALGCGAVLTNVRRTMVGRYSVADAVPFDQLLKTSMSDFPTLVRPLSEALAR